MSLLRHELPYSADSAVLFDRISQRHWAVYLDSGQPLGEYGRYDIMAAEPFITLTTHGGQTEIRDQAGVLISTDNPFLLLKQTLADYAMATSNGLFCNGSFCNAPFCGGAIGYFGYDLARRLEQLPELAVDSEHIPQMMVGIYDWAVIVDHRERRAWLVSPGFDTRTHAQWHELCALFELPCVASAAKVVPSFKVTTGVTSNMYLPAYATAFNRVKDYLEEGDCYQVNLAQRFAARAEGDAWMAYQHLRQISPAPFMAYMNYPDLQVLSGSPERFLQVTGRHVETRPIKGTRPRSDDATEDAANAEELRKSAKDQAENLMIVDLLRNDISKSCVLGSVQAKNLFTMESFANVHHLVSTITGELSPGKSALDLLHDCFPGGSVTGAPKLRAMEIIEELEPQRRGLYCGAIGYMGFDGNMDTSIAIRTAIYSDGEIRFWAGGGIVADSEMQKEYGETWDKASSMLALTRHFHRHNNE
jgi:para-aminobenzoate synthetase component 1